MKRYSPMVSLMVKAAEKSNDVLQRDFREIELLQRSKNGSSIFASKTFEKVVNLVMNSLLKHSESCNFFDLEGNFLQGREEEKSENFFIGIDGMLNFERSIPYFSLVIGKMNEKQKLDTALVFCPGLLEYYIVEKGSGAWKETINGFGNESVRLKVSLRKSENPVVSLSDNIQYSNEGNKLNFNAESIAIAYVAAGKLDAHYLSGKPFSKLLAALFIEEAEGVLTEKSEYTVVSNQLY
jgi:fructose-1,6-bisphosphatase/inositol monophosphatase family enzyme